MNTVVQWLPRVHNLGILNLTVLARFVPDLDDIVCFEDLMKEEEQEASAMPDETVAAARFVLHVYRV